MPKATKQTQAAQVTEAKETRPSGRPKFSFSADVAKKLAMLERHLIKRGGEFTPTEVTKSLSLQLREVKNPRMRVKQWMDVLVEQGKLVHVGFKPSGGKPAKLYGLPKGTEGKK